MKSCDVLWFLYVDKFPINICGENPSTESDSIPIKRVGHWFNRDTFPAGFSPNLSVGATPSASMLEKKGSRWMHCLLPGCRNLWKTDVEPKEMDLEDVVLICVHVGHDILGGFCVTFRVCYIWVGQNWAKQWPPRSLILTPITLAGLGRLGCWKRQSSWEGTWSNKLVAMQNPRIVNSYG